jgi:hypothetical protein
MTLKEEFKQQIWRTNDIDEVWAWIENEIHTERAKGIVIGYVKAVDDVIERIRKIRDKEYSAHFVKREYNALNVAINVVQQLKEKK